MGLVLPHLDSVTRCVPMLWCGPFTRVLTPQSSKVVAMSTKRQLSPAKGVAAVWKEERGVVLLLLPPLFSARLGGPAVFLKGW